MSADRHKTVNRPFCELGALLKRRNFSLAPNRAFGTVHDPHPGPAGKETDREIFLRAMADVTPVVFKNQYRVSRPVRSICYSDQSDDQHTLSALNRLVNLGEGFVVSQTPEYMESASPGVDAETLRHLHQGRYAIQDYVDLHGFHVPEAEQVMNRFIRRAVEKGYRAVLIVHGRGLTSPKEPVLKHKVYLWLTRGHLKKWVLALTSARLCDGGAGATYVLLRQQPMTKGRRKKLEKK